MGCSNSVSVIDRAQVLTHVHHHVVFRVNPSQAYNFFQESLLHPRRYVFYDTREKKEFQAQTVQGAQWAWDYYDSGVAYGSSPAASSIMGPYGSAQALSDVRSQNSSFTCASPRNHYSSRALSSNAYHQFLRETSDGRTIVVCGDGRNRAHLMEFLHHLVGSGTEFRLLCVLGGGVAAMRTRYKHTLTTSQMACGGPVEILPPTSMKDNAKEPALFVSGTDVLPMQIECARHFRVSVVINLSSVGVRILPGLKLITYTSKYGTPDFHSAVKSIRFHLKQRQPVLVVDDQNGREYASAACVAYLVSEGVPATLAISFVKERKPSADVNHLMAVLSFMTDDYSQRQSKIAPQFRQNKVKDAGIPMECLDRWDDDDFEEVEEVKEVVLDAPPPVVIPTATVSPDQASSVLASNFPGKRAIRFEMKQSAVKAASEKQDSKKHKSVSLTANSPADGDKEVEDVTSYANRHVSDGFYDKRAIPTESRSSPWSRTTEALQLFSSSKKEPLSSTENDAFEESFYTSHVKSVLNNTDTDIDESSRIPASEQDTLYQTVDNKAVYLSDQPDYEYKGDEEEEYFLDRQKTNEDENTLYTQEDEATVYSGPSETLEMYNLNG